MNGVVAKRSKQQQEKITFPKVGMKRKVKLWRRLNCRQSFCDHDPSSRRSPFIFYNQINSTNLICAVHVKFRGFASLSALVERLGEGKEEGEREG